MGNRPLNNENSNLTKLNAMKANSGEKKYRKPKGRGFFNEIKNTFKNTGSKVSSTLTGISNMSAMSNIKDMSGYAKYAFYFIYAIVLIVIIVIVKNIIVFYYNYVEDSPYLIAGTKNANHSVVISQDPGSINYIPIKKSENQNGIEFTYMFWCFYNDKQDNLKDWKHIFHKGNSDSLPSRAPGVWFHPSNNAIRVYMNTNNKILDYTDILDIPVKKWFHCTIVVQNKISHMDNDDGLIYEEGKNHVLDIYINGKLKKNHMLKGVPKQNDGDLWINSDGGYNGYLSKLKYYNRAIEFTELESIVNEGYAKVITSDTGEMPPFFNSQWWFKDN